MPPRTEPNLPNVLLEPSAPSPHPILSWRRLPVLLENQHPLLLLAEQAVSSPGRRRTGECSPLRWALGVKGQSTAVGVTSAHGRTASGVCQAVGTCPGSQTRAAPRGLLLGVFCKLSIHLPRALPSVNGGEHPPDHHSSPLPGRALSPPRRASGARATPKHTGWSDHHSNTWLGRNASKNRGRMETKARLEPRGCRQSRACCGRPHAARRHQPGRFQRWRHPGRQHGLCRLPAAAALARSSFPVCCVA